MKRLLIFLFIISGTNLFSNTIMGSEVISEIYKNQKSISATDVKKKDTILIKQMYNSEEDYIKDIILQAKNSWSK